MYICASFIQSPRSPIESLFISVAVIVNVRKDRKQVASVFIIDSEVQCIHFMVSIVQPCILLIQL